MDLGTRVAAITALCYAVGYVAKLTKLDNKWIPVICGGVGIVLGILGMYCVPGFPASDPITAALVGLASGLSATGINQIGKQLSNNTNNKDSEG